MYINDDNDYTHCTVLQQYHKGIDTLSGRV